MSGYRFLGGGVEVTPGKFRGAAFYGRLQKAVDYDSTSAAKTLFQNKMNVSGNIGLQRNDLAGDQMF